MPYFRAVQAMVGTIVVLVLGVVGLFLALIGAYLLNESLEWQDSTQEVCCGTDIREWQCQTVCNSGESCLGFERSYIALSQGKCGGTELVYKLECTDARARRNDCPMTCWVRDDCSTYTTTDPKGVQTAGIVMICVGTVIMAPYMFSFCCLMMFRRRMQAARESLFKKKVSSNEPIEIADEDLDSPCRDEGEEEEEDESGCSDEAHPQPYPEKTLSELGLGREVAEQRSSSPCSPEEDLGGAGTPHNATANAPDAGVGIESKARSVTVMAAV